jgi:hypothetical protein
MGWALTYEFEDVTALEIELMSLMRTHSPFRLAMSRARRRERALHGDVLWRCLWD